MEFSGVVLYSAVWGLWGVKRNIKVSTWSSECFFTLEEHLRLTSFLLNFKWNYLERSFDRSFDRDPFSAVWGFWGAKRALRVSTCPSTSSKLISALEGLFQGNELPLELQMKLSGVARDPISTIRGLWGVLIFWVHFRSWGAFSGQLAPSRTSDGFLWSCERSFLDRLRSQRD